LKRKSGREKPRQSCPAIQEKKKGHPAKKKKKTQWKSSGGLQDEKEGKGKGEQRETENCRHFEGAGEKKKRKRSGSRKSRASTQRLWGREDFEKRKKGKEKGENLQGGKRYF